MEKSYIRVNKKEYLKYLNPLFNVPIKIIEVRQNQFTGEEKALVKSNNNKWYIVHVNQDAVQEYGNDEVSAKKEWELWRT